MSPIRPRAVFGAMLAALLSGLAPAAAAQGLIPIEASPIPYRVSLPMANWIMSTEDEMLTVGNGRDVVIIASATDLVALQEDPLPDAEERRILTQRFMGSDSVMMEVMTRVAAGGRGLEQEGLVQEIRTLGGQRAAYIRDRSEEDGEITWRQSYVTVKDGVLYMLVFVVRGRNPDRHRDLFNRIRDSFAPAEAPPG